MHTLPSDDSAGERNGATPVLARVRARDLVFVVALTVGALFAIGLLIGDPTLTIGFVLMMLLLQSVVSLGAVYLVIVKGRRLRWAGLGLRTAPRGWYLRGVLLGILTVPLIAFVNYSVQTVAGTDFRNPQLDVLAPGGFTWAGLVGMLVMAGIVAPVVEEIVFRGLLYQWLRERMGLTAGAVLSALAFSAAHGIGLLVPALAVQGVILAMVYERSGSLWPPVILHGVFNMVMTSTLYAALAAGVPLD